jgi:hypothetical protein
MERVFLIITCAAVIVLIAAVSLTTPKVKLDNGPTMTLLQPADRR